MAPTPEPPQWPGTVVDPSLPGGRADCVLVLRGRTLVARLASGETMKLALDRAEIERSGPGGGSLALVSADPTGPTFLCADPRAADAVRALHESQPARGRTAAAPPAGRRLRTAHKVVLGVLAFLLGIAATPFLLMGPLARVAMKAVPVAFDEELGNGAYPALLDQMSFGEKRLREEPAVREVVDVIMKRLAIASSDSPFRFRVEVLESPIVNAFALPGGRMVVTTALLGQLGSAEELAGVLAHEASHVRQRHAIEQMVRGAGLGLALQGIVGDGRSVGRGLLAAAASLGALAFTRDMEARADAAAVRLLADALIDPGGTVRFMETLGRLEAARGAPGVLRTHPLTGERVRDLRAQIARLPAFEPLPVLADWAALRATIDGVKPRPARPGVPGRDPMREMTP